jgi:ubiquinone/menaquinone biosynthesis C-methylase UbiE
MTGSDAIQLIRGGTLNTSGTSRWADLGSGSGTFTKALARLLAEGSSILAIDQEDHEIEAPNDTVVIQFLRADFTKASLPHSLDGILMANALHYVKDQPGFLRDLSAHLKPGGQLIVVEYDTDYANEWVPYPVTYKKLQGWLLAAGYESVQKIGEMNSIYRQHKIYACAGTATHQ